MDTEFERFDMSRLLDAYVKESKAFSTAVEQGAAWERLREHSLRIRRIGALINNKHRELYGERRLRNQPPHGD